MSPFIHSAFWSDPEIEVVSSDAKLAVLWIITNGQTSIIGLCNATEKRFAFETGLAPSILQDACNALPNMLLQTSDGIWVRNYIHHQFGRGEKLSRNNCYRAIGNAVSQLQDQALILAIYTHYPEMEGLCKPLVRASVPLTKGSRREQRGTEVNGLASEKGEKGETEDPVVKPKAAPCDRPTRPEFDSHVIGTLGMTLNDAEHVWNVWEENGWTRSQAGKQVPIARWKSALSTWKTGKYFPSLKTNGYSHNGQATTQHKRSI